MQLVGEIVAGDGIVKYTKKIPKFEYIHVSQILVLVERAGKIVA